MFLPIVAVLCILPFTAQALRGQLEIGGDRGQHSGIELLAAAMNSLPAGTIGCDYSLEWELDFYLGDHSSVRMVFQPTPQALARTVCAATKPSYFATTASDSVAWRQPIQVRGSAVILADGQFQLYHLSCTL